MKAKSILFPAGALTIICLVISVALAFTNYATKDKIAEQEKKKEIEAAGQVLSDAADFNEIQGAPDSVIKAFEGTKDSNCVGYVFQTSSSGYGGEVVVMVGMDTEGKITGAQILSCEETPGLGKKAQDDSSLLLDNFKDKSGQVKLVKGDAADGEVSAITGATITSTAVTEAVNKALDAYKAVKGA